MKADRSVKIKNGNVQGSINTGNINYGVSETHQRDKTSGNHQSEEASLRSESNTSKITKRNCNTGIGIRLFRLFFSFLDSAQRTEYFWKLIAMLGVLAAIVVGSVPRFIDQETPVQQHPETQQMK